MTTHTRLIRASILRVACAGLVGLAAAPAAWADQTKTSTDAASGEARQAFEAAKEFYKQGKFIEALGEFKKAYEKKPSPSLTYNIARCYEQLSQWQEAISSYEKFANETTDVRQRTEALDKIEFLRSKLAPDAASPEARYKVKIDNGKKEFQQGNFEAAIREFKAAYDIKPSPGVLYNIAKAYEKMARYEEAIDFYTQYLDLNPSASDRPDVEETVRRLKKSIKDRFQELSVSSDPPLADVYLDDRNSGLQGQTNLRIKVAPGPHTLYLDLNGTEPVKRDFVMPDDKPLALEFQMKKLANIGNAVITVSVDGARIFIDGAIVGLSPYKQKKQLSAGNHQLTVEAQGFPRVTRDFEIIRDKDTPLDIKLEKPSEPVFKDDTLKGWGSNFLILGIVGGALGFAAPWAYEQLVLRRTLYSALGPSQVSWGGSVKPADAVYWQGLNGKKTLADKDYGANIKKNSQLDLLNNVQLYSIIGGSSFAAVGLGLYIWYWARPDTKVEVVNSTASLDAEPALDSPEPSAEVVEVTGLGVVPGAGGAVFGISGSF
jgi:tetratricopeptide (TPR) repeat protein